MSRVEVLKTWKLFIGGGFPRTESGRTLVLEGAGGRVVAHCCRGSRKDLRNAIESARGSLAGWWGRDAYNRGQILYRLAEMAEGRREELVDAIRAVPAVGSGRTPTRAAAVKQVDASIDRLVGFAGWCDKFPQVVGCRNPVNGPYHDFTAPEPSGVCIAIAPESQVLLGLVSTIAPMLAGGNVVVDGLSKYKENWVVDQTAMVKVWLPADVVFFSGPLWLRLPLRHVVSFGWTAYVSFLRGA